MDVHQGAIVAAILPRGSDRIEETVKIDNEAQAIARWVKRVVRRGPCAFVYEAGPCGYEVARQLAGMGQVCRVIAPGLTPVRPGDRVKTDRRDAEKLARLYRAGELTEIRVPTREEEAGRDLVRVREDVLADRLRARHRLSKFLLRQGRIYREGRAWTQAHGRWLGAQRFACEPLARSFEAYGRAVAEADARLAVLDQQVLDLAQTAAYREPVRRLRCLKGIDTLSAVTLVVEAQAFERFGSAGAFMSYTGAVPSESSSGQRVRRGSITKAGNAHLRRILVEAAWSYRKRSVMSRMLAARRQGCPPEVVRIAQAAEDRLSRKFGRLVSRGKPYQVAVVAVARELAGFVWAIARQTPAPAVG
jgi:transposase